MSCTNYKEIFEIQKEILEILKEIKKDKEDIKANYQTDSLIISTNDINTYMEEYLSKRITDEMDLSEKKKIIEEELKQYIYAKLQLFELFFYDANFSIFYLLGRLLDKSHNENIVDNFILYLVRLLSKLQNHEFYWYIEENTEAFAPYVDSREEKIYGLVSHKDTYSIDIFATLWDYFLNEFNEKEEIVRK